MPVTGAVPPLVSTNTWIGSRAQATIWAGVVPGQLRVWVGVQTAGARATVTPLPLRVTGEPLTGTLAVMVKLPVTEPSAVGENTTFIVQFAPAARVAPQLGAPAGNGPTALLEKRGDEKASAIPVAVAVPVLCRVRFCDALVVPMRTL